MKKIALIVLGLLVMILPAYSFGKKNMKPKLYIASNTADLSASMQGQRNFPWVFKKDEKIYFQIINPKGFKSDYIKYQIIKQDDNANIGGYSRVRNITIKVKSKYNFEDYFVLSEKGKYFIQIFDIENLQHWLAIGSFLVVE